MMIYKRRSHFQPLRVYVIDFIFRLLHGNLFASSECAYTWDILHRWLSFSWKISIEHEYKATDAFPYYIDMARASIELDLLLLHQIQQQCDNRQYFNAVITEFPLRNFSNNKCVIRIHFMQSKLFTFPMNCWFVIYNKVTDPSRCPIRLSIDCFPDKFHKFTASIDRVFMKRLSEMVNSLIMWRPKNVG